jgi:hypothetical protein
METFNKIMNAIVFVCWTIMLAVASNYSFNIQFLTFSCMVVCYLYWIHSELNEKGGNKR